MRFKKIEVRAFGGISPDAPIILDFTKGKWIIARGDQGVNKTSLLNSLLVATGQISHTSEAGKNFINRKSGKIDIDFEFVGKDRCNYRVRCTKSAFTLEYDGMAVPEPLTKMKELVGTIGVSPMGIKNSKVADIVKWLASYTNKSAEEFEAEIRKLKDGAKKAAETRAAANKILKANDEYLSGEPMAQAWEESEQKYNAPIDMDVLAKQLRESNQAHNQYLNGEKRLKELQENRVRLEKELEQVKMLELDGQVWLSDHAHVVMNHAEVTNRYESAVKDSINYNKWQEIKRKKSERDQAEDISQKANGQEKELLKKMADLRAEILPDIKGVELILEDTHENGQQKKEGLYWNGINTAQMSETEWWTLVMQIWRKYKVPAVVIDNMQSLGSEGIALLQKLSKDAYILAAEMNREQKTLQIEYE